MGQRAAATAAAPQVLPATPKRARVMLASLHGTKKQNTFKLEPRAMAVDAETIENPSALPGAFEEPEDESGQDDFSDQDNDHDVRYFNNPKTVRDVPGAAPENPEDDWEHDE